ncbi:MAG: branched-chain amino acid ABC transporter permease [Burkholderiales bacterium]|nr:branched-chain amino acid ABC transporter permease [Burkholderiales bacterium]
MKFAYDTSYAESRRLMRWKSERVAYALLLALLLVAPWVLPVYYVTELTFLFIFSLASLGLMVLTGYTGQVSLGHAAFIAIGAYAEALLLARGLPFPLTLLGAALIAAAAGVAIGLPAIRVSGLYLAMVTLAFSIVVEHLSGHWTALTGGFTGMAVPDVKLLGLALSQPVVFYCVCLVVLVLVLLALINLMRAHAGRAFVGVRDSEAAAHGLGIHVARTKVLAFALSAGITGLAGALLAHQTKYLTPDGFGLMLSMQLVLAVVIGGLGSLRGAILGAILIGLLPALISQFKPFLPDRIARQFGLETFVFGAVLVGFVLFEPQGLNGRWLKLRALFETFPLYRRDTFRRAKTYMRSERVR